MSPSFQATALNEHNTESANEETTTTTDTVEEFQDVVYHKAIIDDYTEDYEDSGEMTDEDYL